MTKRVLAVASGGGHWLELCRITPAFEGLEVAFVSVHPMYASQVAAHRYYTVRDVSRRNWWISALLIPQLVRIVLKERPDVVITTGSAPALFALGFAKLIFGAKTIWIDSIANVEKLSSSGTVARLVSDVWLTQWPALQTQYGPACWGAVI